MIFFFLMMMIEVDLENVGEVMVLHPAGEQALQRIG